MLKRYELTDQEWNQIAPLLPPEKSNRPGRPSKDNRTMLNAMVWIARSGAPWRDLPERYGPWETVYSRFRKWIEDNYLDIFHIPVSRLPVWRRRIWKSTRIFRRPRSFTEGSEAGYWMGSGTVIRRISRFKTALACSYAVFCNYVKK